MVGVGGNEVVIERGAVYIILLEVSECSLFQVSYRLYHHGHRLYPDEVVIAKADGVWLTLFQQSVNHLPLLAAHYPVPQEVHTRQAVEVAGAPCRCHLPVKALRQSHLGRNALTHLRTLYVYLHFILI